ncbi:MAG: sugar-binding domain-containing protein, partial [Micromonosporaceae bacterium]
MNQPVHPRPQLVRDEWVDLGGEWDFAFDDADRGLAERWFAAGGSGEAGGSGGFERKIAVPYPPESKLSGVGDTGFHPVVWYRREFTAPHLPPGGRLLLHFGAVDHRATVWVNGALVGGHTGGQTRFSLDVTDELAGDGPQTVVVRAEDRPDDVSQPRGKQDWRTEPHGIFYDRTTGIWQPVWLEPVPETYVASLHWTPDLPANRVAV